MLHGRLHVDEIKIAGPVRGPKLEWPDSLAAMAFGYAAAKEGYVAVDEHAGTIDLAFGADPSATPAERRSQEVRMIRIVREGDAFRILGLSNGEPIGRGRLAHTAADAASALHAAYRRAVFCQGGARKGLDTRS